ncbi:hypothetical protein QFZ23_002350 [Arthrobacter globiformis]|uniref:hypothetical protein n=1 Tax=Arthrobacter globiformis TaxID=1665 RepID=UPI00278361C3|nr:hypothetical protein [Arthrobacter globiformis]MDQ1058449.1 hypothetical protein [Arthrobacter globiformis]
MKTRSMHHSLAAATLAVIVLTSTACTAQPGGPQRSVTTPGATPTSTAEPTTAATTSSSAPNAETRHGKHFTFPDGHISFNYPADWTVRTEQGPYLTEKDKAGSVIAVLADSSGSEVARIHSGMYGDAAAGPAKRTVLDHAPVRGITDKAGEPTEFGFGYDIIAGRPDYFMDVRLAHEFLPSQDSSGTNQVLLANGVMSAFGVFHDEKKPAFATPEAAKAWTATEKFHQLKGLLLSLEYK